MVHQPSSDAPRVEPLASFEVVWGGDVVVIRASGEIDAHSARTLDVLCESLVVPGSPLAVRLDAARVTFIDCGGLRGIVAAAARVGASGGSFAVTTPSDRVAWLLDLCQIDLRAHVPAPPRHRRSCRTRVPLPRRG